MACHCSASRDTRPPPDGLGHDIGCPEFDRGWCQHKDPTRFDVDAIGGHYDVLWCSECGSIKRGDDAWEAPQQIRNLRVLCESLHV